MILDQVCKPCGLSFLIYKMEMKHNTCVTGLGWGVYENRPGKCLQWCLAHGKKSGKGSQYYSCHHHCSSQRAVCSGLGEDNPGFKSCLYHFLAVWLGVSCWPSLGLRIPIYSPEKAFLWLLFCFPSSNILTSQLPFGPGLLSDPA